MEDPFPRSWHRAATSNWSQFVTAPVSMEREHKDIDVIVSGYACHLVHERILTGSTADGSRQIDRFDHIQELYQIVHSLAG
jgi:hypothetical protein